MHAHTRGDCAISWIEQFCLYPDGPSKGKRVILSPAECWQVRQLYDDPDGPKSAPLTGTLAAYLALLHICGPEAKQKQFRPTVSTDAWTVWRATSPDLQRVLKREGETVVCPALGTKFPLAA
jgi:hypothetical protein